MNERVNMRIRTLQSRLSADVMAMIKQGWPKHKVYEILGLLIGLDEAYSYLSNCDCDCNYDCNCDCNCNTSESIRNAMVGQTSKYVREAADRSCKGIRIRPITRIEEDTSAVSLFN